MNARSYPLPPGTLQPKHEIDPSRTQHFLMNCELCQCTVISDHWQYQEPLTDREMKICSDCARTIHEQTELKENA